MKIKICGLTRPEEAEYLNRNQVDYAGFVLFCEKSRRNNTIQQAEAVMAKLDSSIKKAAVVVEPSFEQIREIEQAGFDLVQIHGRIADELLETITIPVWKAFNVKDMDLYDTYRKSPQITGYVFDAAEAGSGKSFDWNLLKKLPRDDKLFFLAGGLHSGNVQAAMEAVHPDGVDVSSGVEYQDRAGKDPEKISAFVNSVRKSI
jgi:phosphoribosylanthranilate isomerase